MPLNSDLLSARKVFTVLTCNCEVCPKPTPRLATFVELPFLSERGTVSLFQNLEGRIIFRHSKTAQDSANPTIFFAEPGRSVLVRLLHVTNLLGVGLPGALIIEVSETTLGHDLQPKLV